jgi:hypothetical protein
MVLIFCFFTETIQKFIISGTQEIYLIIFQNHTKDFVFWSFKNPLRFLETIQENLIIIFLGLWKISLIFQNLYKPLLKINLIITNNY